MDIYGNPTEQEGLLNGGTISGDLQIDGNVVIDGDLDVTGTITAVDELEVKDCIITTCVDNPADAFNSGIIMARNANTQYAGLVRSAAGGGRFKLIGDMSSITPGSLLVPNGSMDLVDIGFTSGMFWDQGHEIKNIAGNLEIVSNSDMKLDAQFGDMIIQSATTTGVAGNTLDLVGFDTAQLLGVNGATVKATSGDITLDASGDVISTADITLPANGDLKWASGNHLIRELGTSLQISSNGNLVANPQGSLLLSSPTSASISSTAFASFIGNSSVRLTSSGGPVLLQSSTGVVVNENADAYTLPLVRGAAAQVLTDVLGDGNLSWEDGGGALPQPLDVTDNPTFNGLSLTQSMVVGGIAGLAGAIAIAKPPTGTSNLTMLDGVSTWAMAHGTQASGGNLSISRNASVKLELTGTEAKVYDPLVLNADTVNSFTMPGVRGAPGQVLTDVAGNGSLSWQDATTPREYAEYWWNNNNLTTTFANTVNFVPVVSSGYNAGPSVGFTLGANALTYNGAGGRFYFNANFGVSKALAGAQDTVWILLLNGLPSLVNTAQQTNVSSTGNIEPVALSCSGIVDLVTNDVITIAARPLNNTEGIEVNSMNFNIQSIEGGGGGGSGGDVVGPASATDRALALYDGATGKLLQDSVATLSADAELGMIGNNARVTLDNLGSEWGLRNQGYFELFKRDSPNIGGGNPEVVLTTQSGRLNLFRPTWVQNSLTVNGGVDSYELPTVRPVAGQVLTATSTTTTGWSNPQGFYATAGQVGNITPTGFAGVGQTVGIVAFVNLGAFTGAWSVQVSNIVSNNPVSALYKIECHGTWSATIVSQRRQLVITVGGVAQPSSTIEADLATPRQSFSTSCIANVANNDSILLTVTAVVGTANTTFTDIHYIVTPV